MRSPEERPGCDPRQLWHRLRGRRPAQPETEAAPAAEPEPETEAEQPQAESYYVRIADEGVYVTHERTQAQYFRTRGGQWFWLMGAGSPFDEDATVGAEHGEYLNSIVASSFIPPDEPSEPLKGLSDGSLPEDSQE